MKKSTFIYYGVILWLLPQFMLAQTNPILSFALNTEAVANNYSVDSLPIITDSTIFNTEISINLLDTMNIQSIDIAVGSYLGGSDIFSRSFIFDQSSGLANGLSYLRDGYLINLGLGNLFPMVTYYSTARLQFVNGTYSQVVVFNR